MRDEFVLPVGRDCERQSGERCEAKDACRDGNAALYPERVELPGQNQHRDRQQSGKADLPGQTRDDLEQEREGGEVDDHQIDEGRRHHQDAMLELRHHDQDDDHGERQHRRRQRPPQQGKPEQIEDTPGQNERRLRLEVVFRPEQQTEGREMDGGVERNLPGIAAIRSRGSETAFQEQDGGRHDRRQSRDLAMRRGVCHHSVIKSSWQNKAAGPVGG
jgi:hypothetical protein